MSFPRKRFGFAWFIVVAHLMAAGLLAAYPTRTALVIGNERYEPAVGALRNTGNDAKAMARALRSLGFAVIEKHDLTRDQLLRTMEAFRKTLPNAEVALFYYAGHGVAIDGANYLIPVKSGFEPANVDAVGLRMLAETRLFNAEQAVADMSSAGTRCNLVILDACRTTRLVGLARDRSPGNRGGLAEMTPPAGSLIAFATDAGHTALDGDGKNGLYTEELLKNVVAPGLTIEQVFKRTRAGVVQRSQGAQVPAEYSRLLGDDVYLAGTIPVRVAIPVSPTPIPERQMSKSERLAEVKKLVATGQAGAREAMDHLLAIARSEGPGEYAIEPLETILEHVKEDLKTTEGPSTKAITSVATCDLILAALPQCVPPGSSKANELSAKAHNRRGDALLLQGKAEEALAEFETALPLAKDAYVYYNRGCAYRALGRIEEARADFQEAASSRFDQPKARKLARAALASLPAAAKE